jgi:hypothetical protein
MASQDKDFFSEEKKQKTFVSALVDRYGTWPDGWEMLKDIKVFCFPQGGLRLFFGKEGLLIRPGGIGSRRRR